MESAIVDDIDVLVLNDTLQVLNLSSMNLPRQRERRLAIVRPKMMNADIVWQMRQVFTMAIQQINFGRKSSAVDSGNQLR